MSDDPTYLTGLEPVFEAMRKAESPNNDRDRRQAGSMNDRFG